MYRTLMLVPLLCAVVLAKDPDPLKETIKEVEAALGKNDAAAAKAAFAKAETLRAGHDDKKLGPLVQAIAKGAGNRNPEIAKAALDALGNLKVAGSTKLFAKALAAPAKVKPEEMPVVEAAIAAAGALHENEGLKPLEKLLDHPNGDLAATAAKTLAHYKALDPKPRRALASRMIKALALAEKEAESAKKPEQKEAAAKLGAGLLEGLTGLCGKEGLTNAKEWEAWLKESEKEA